MPRSYTILLATTLAGALSFGCAEVEVTERTDEDFEGVATTTEVQEATDYEAASEDPASDDEADPLSATLDGDLPPADPLALEPLYGEALRGLGMELTDRGGLIDRTDGYTVSEDGTHLALYVSPIGDRSDDDYLDGIVELAQVFLPEAFERWPGLETFDVCQELPPGPGEDGYDTPVTQIDLSRDAARSIDWETVDLVDLMQADRTSDAFTLRIYGDLARHERVIAARDEAISRIDDQLHPDG